MDTNTTIIFDSGLPEKTDIDNNDTLLIADNEDSNNKGKTKKITVNTLLSDSNSKMSTIDNNIKSIDSNVADLKTKVNDLEKAIDPSFASKYSFQAVMTFTNTAPFCNENFCSINHSETDDTLMSTKLYSTLLHDNYPNTDRPLDMISNEVNESVKIYSNHVQKFKIENGIPMHSVLLTYPENIDIECNNTSISDIALGQLPKLQKFTYNTVKNLKKVDLSNNLSVGKISIKNSDIEEVILPTDSTKITDLDLSSNSKLSHLDLTKNRFANLHKCNLVGTPYFTVDRLNDLAESWDTQPSSSKGVLTINKSLYEQISDNLKKKFTDKYINIVAQ